MNKSLLLSKRNRLFINLFAIGLLLHTLSSLFIPYQFTVSIPFFAIIYCILLFILKRMNINNTVMQFLILGGMNGYILHLNLDTPYYIHVLLFVYPLFIASLYHSIISSLILLPITVLEVIYIFQRNFQDFKSTIEFGDLYVVLLLLILMSLTAVVHSLFMRTTWERVEEQQATLERALDSREGYLHMFFENAKDGIAVYDA